MTTDHTISGWSRVLVYGIGVSGRAAIRLLLDRKIRVLAVDAREPSSEDLDELARNPELELRLGKDPERCPPGLDAVILSPGVPLERPLVVSARELGIPVLGEVELAFPLARGPILAVTGSNGKSTTVALAGAMLEAGDRPVEVCGNIGRPLCEAVTEAPDATFVVELSSFQLETIDAFRPVAAALLNLSPDHLDRYPGLEEYRRAKKRIFENQTSGDVAILPGDSEQLRSIRPAARARRFSRTRPVEDGCVLDGQGRILERVSGRNADLLFRAEDLRIPGPHNLENAMAASLLVRAVGLEPTAIREGAKRFRGLPHRTELVAEPGGIPFYDDSKGTNIGATRRALEAFPDGSVHLILGGRAKEADFEPLVSAVARAARRVYLIGESAEQIGRALGDRVPWCHSGDLATAVSRAAETARPGEVVLLSPACASFDQYADFQERGQHFQHLVDEIVGRGRGQEARL